MSKLETLHCWLRLGHRWHYITTDDRECTRCGLRQYVAIECEMGVKYWDADRSHEARASLTDAEGE